MVVRLFRLSKLAGVHGDRWTAPLGISIDVRCLLGDGLMRGDLLLPRQRAGFGCLGEANGFV
jgi:hypothetical protein